MLEKLDTFDSAVCLKDMTCPHKTTATATNGFTIAWDEFQPLTAKNSPCLSAAPAEASKVTIFLDDFFSGFGDYSMAGGMSHGYSRADGVVHSELQDKVGDLVIKLDYRNKEYMWGTVEYVTESVEDKVS